MTELKRLEPLIDFPPYAFLPGKNNHPNKPGGYRFEQIEPSALIIDLDAPEENHSFRYGIDLMNFGFFWESHVYFEALWNAHQRSGSVAVFLKALIKIAAAGIKHELGQTAAFTGHLERALELLHELHEAESNIFLGFDIVELINRNKISIQNASMALLPLYPSWK